MDVKDYSKLLLDDLYSLSEDKIKEVRDFIQFLKYKSNIAFFPQNISDSHERNLREGWREKFRSMLEKGDDELLDKDLLNLTSWDKEEWEWK